jgi:outer membrane protein insertion porin family
LNARINGYNTVTQEAYYVRKSHGFGLTAAYPVYRAWNLSVGIARDGSKLAGFRPAFGRSVRDYYAKYGVDAKQYLNTSDNSLSIALARDTRSGGMIPTNGTRFVLGTRISGFGADVYYHRYFCESAYYRPLFWKAIMKVQTNVSALAEWENQPIPFDKRILLGGISSIRGYQYGEIGPLDKYGAIIGGDRAMYANVECLVPLIERLNLNGVVFADAGNAWNVEQSPFPEEVKAGAGVGLRWLSPMGPIRIEYGWKINPKKGESPGAFAFAMGQLF